MYKYEDITFMIPVKFDTADRERNMVLSVNWLNTIYPFKFIIQESDVDSKFDRIRSKMPMSNINYSFLPQRTTFFQRTLVGNNMLDMVQTSLVCNFDCDVIMEKRNIDAVLDKFNKGYECVYPYTYGNNTLRINRSLVHEGENSLDVNFDKFLQKFVNKELSSEEHTSLYGYAVFLKTKIYKRGYGENENFHAWGPEDIERYNRFKKLGFNVTHLDDVYKIHHLEHHRGIDSLDTHDMVGHNYRLNDHLSGLDRLNLNKTYKKYEYVKNRNYGI